METTQKRLTRIQLVNWHYFENERIALNGSTLLSGENTAGKSTILDAMQLVLTTNSRKFNVAANEKGNRTLKGYVRCKVGNVGETYRRKGTVPANVALEFYEEKSDRYFVLGVHLISQDEESQVIKKWYAEECRLEDLSFIVDGRAALAEEFRNKTRKIRYIETDKGARDRFRHRMGNLDEKFFDIIPKSLAFKPMDNVKDFINKFVLSEERVNVQGLRDNIETLGELEIVLERTRKQLEGLDGILAKYEQIQGKERDIKVNDILLKLAGSDACEQMIEELEKEIRIKSQTIEGNNENLKYMDSEIEHLTNMIIALNVDIQNNESNKLVESVKNQIAKIESRLKDNKENKKELMRRIAQVENYLRLISALDITVISGSEFKVLSSDIREEEKYKIVERLEEHFKKEYKTVEEEKGKLFARQSALDEEINSLREKQRNLEKRKLSYNENTEELKKLIETEFDKRGINSKVYILSELLEIADERWRNAVEGYLNMQKFYLVVEPEYYDMALSIYNENRNRIHTAGIINTKRIPLEYEEDNRSLSYVVKSENRYAKAYVNYVLGRVIRCENVQELEKYRIAITPECMLYQGYVVRHLNPRDYRNPYIGLNAYRVQLENVRKKIEELVTERNEVRDLHETYSHITEAKGDVNLDVMKLYLNAPFIIKTSEEELTKAKAELKNAAKDPNLIELNIRLSETEEQREAKTKERDGLTRSNENLKLQVEDANNRLSEERRNLSLQNDVLKTESDSYGLEYKDAEEKYRLNRKTKAPQKIYENFSPQRSQLENEMDDLLNGDTGLKSLQMRFNTTFTQDFTVGVTQMSDYREAADKLRKVEVVKYEEKLMKAKEDCEQIFRSDFLSKMKEHIENAKTEFKNLNKALDSIYYGDDSYHFNITFDKRKENLYRMITSEYNMEGDNNLWTTAFEAEYREEMDDLFAKLMVRDDKGEKVLEEYTDYRSYLDYDIEIRKRNGQRQKFSDIYGEKSGSETQVPYYVAIAASFYQLYRFGNSVRLMLLDEAFDKMDDDRIKSMMDFFNSLNLQVILATPPSKIEVIGEHVDTILTAIRVGEGSIVEEYEL